MLKEDDIKVGDRITFKYDNEDEARTLIVFDTFAVKNYIYMANKISDSIKILKIERPKYDIVEEKKEILDEVEKRYLSNLIKPFRGDVLYIQKLKTETYKRKYIYIKLENDNITLPFFPKGKDMYKGMILGKEYTLKELGL